MKEISSPTKGKRIDLLDYLKAISILMVIITHYDWAKKTSPAFILFIDMAVPIFMIISGYNFAMSYQKNTDGTLPDMYSSENILPRVHRFLRPFFFIYIIELVLSVALDETLKYGAIETFFRGGIGPGSYYVPLLIQLLLVFPLIFFFVKKSAFWGVLTCGIINLLYEFVIVFFDVEKIYYRLCIGRYILLIAFGCYLFLHPDHKLKKRDLAIMITLGVIFILTRTSADYMIAKWELFPYWGPTAFPVAFYIFPLVIIAFRLFYHKQIPGYTGELLALIGKASYHIFLVQMVYYHFNLGGALMDKHWLFAIPYNVVVTVSVGIAFYRVENNLRKSKYVGRYFN